MSERGAISGFLALALGSAAAGLIVGSVLVLTGLVGGDDAPTDSIAIETASYRACPDGTTVGTLARGDRVLITARNADGDWVEIRSPVSSGSRVWMRARQVVPDGDTSHLPVVDCHLPVAVIAAEATTTTIPESQTTTTAPDATTTTATTTTTTTTTSTTTTTTLPAAPSVLSVTTDHADLWEVFPGDEACSNLPANRTQTTVRATVSAPAGVKSITRRWSSGGSNGTVNMAQSGGMYVATLGKFFTDNPGAPSGQQLTITVTVTVTDNLDRQATGQATVTLHDCAGLG